MLNDEYKKQMKEIGELADKHEGLNRTNVVITSAVHLLLTLHQKLDEIEIKITGMDDRINEKIDTYI